MIEECTATVIATDVAFGTAIGDMQLATTVPATEHAGQKHLAAADRAARHETRAIGIVSNQTLIPFVLGP